MAHEDLMTAKQVAEWLHMSTRFVKEHAADMGGVRMGGSVKKAGALRFRESKVQEWINGGGSTPASTRRPNETSPRQEPERMAG
jgi:hypothetical protein